jgi:hypothetical protein
MSRTLNLTNEREPPESARLLDEYVAPWPSGLWSPFRFGCPLK